MENPTEYNVTMGGDVAALFAALAKAQGQMGAAKKGADNPHFKSRFADLATVLEAILPPLNANGLALVQLPGHAEGKVTLTTMITHTGGAWLCSKAATDVGRGSGPQAVGSAISYLRRYCAQAALALPAEDDDGEAAMGRGRGRQAPAKAKPQPKPKPKAEDDHHPSWKSEYKSFMANAQHLVTVNADQNLMDAVVAEAKALGFEKRPSQMDSSERRRLLAELAGEVF